MQPDVPRSDLDPRFSQVQARDQSATFVYAVLSTGIYCRPSCPARRPLPKNVAFYPTPSQAELAGFRPCKRCRPDAERAPDASGPVLAMCSLLELEGPPPRLAQLAAHVGLSAPYAQRLFVKATGLTPRAYRQALVRRRVQAELQDGRSVTAALYASGYGASSRFYEDAPALLGMSPKEVRAGGKNSRIHFAVGTCSLGAILVAATARGVCAVLLGDDPSVLIADLERRFPHAESLGAEPGFETTVARVVALVEGSPAVALAALPLDIRGTIFQERVWRALAQIPPGQTTTYAALAASLGMPDASRAVAGACAKNPAAVVVPCHRVVRSDGSLAGYRWGIERKRELLRRERESTGR